VPAEQGRDLVERKTDGVLLEPDVDAHVSVRRVGPAIGGSWGIFCLN
jgi:hypothetical protein